MDSPDISYLAGFFDGEGCVNIGGDGKRWRGQLMVSNTVRQSVEWYRRWGGNVYVIPPSTKTTVPRIQESYTWQASGQEAAKALRDLLPFLRVKREQAENALEFFRVMAQGPGARSVQELLRLVARHKALSFYSRTPPPTPLVIPDPQGKLLDSEFIDAVGTTQGKASVTVRTLHSSS